MRLYVLDVGVYARAPLLSSLARLVADGCCVVTGTVLHVFHHRLVGSIEYFVERYDDIKQSLRVLFPRHSRRLNALRSLKLLEAKRQGRQDAMLYTVYAPYSPYPQSGAV